MQNNGTISIDGFPLGYQIEGKGAPVLVIGSTVYYPRLFSPAIRESLQLIFIDHRGFVQPSRALQPADYTLDRIVEDIETMRRSLGLEKFSILGHSGHAFLATEYAIRYSQSVENVILLNTAPTNSDERQAQSFAFFAETASPERKAVFEREIALLAGDLEREPERRFAHVCIRMGAHSFFDYSFEGAYLWDGVYTNMPVIDHLWGDAFARLNLLDRLSLVNKPVFLGLGAFDYLVGPASLWDDVEQRHPHVTKVLFTRSGHNPMLEEPEQFDARIMDWIHQGGFS